ncbi:MAG: galactosamine-6-phosphate isomerase [Cyclobacteriaceae bacterium]|nr:galactosamine-6-phosphate isomerase [Cyclobacteriaceae bacterium]
MNITWFDDYDLMSESAASIIYDEIRERRKLVLCAATGNSPRGLYKRLVDYHYHEPSLFDQLTVVKLDEWGGLPKNHPSSCEYYLRNYLIEPLQIPAGRFISFASDAQDPESECRSIQRKLDKQGPIDICILGLGSNGHIGFNEPAAFLEPFCHVAKLAASSLNHSMVQTIGEKPIFGLTLGLKDILNSKRIIMLITGDHKQKVTEELLNAQIDTNLPASFLWLHSQVDCLIHS